MRKKALLACALLFSTSLLATEAGKTLTLENKNVEVVFDAESGALLRMTDKHSGWEIMKREVLGQSFELLLPMEGSEMTDADRRFNVVKGFKQAKPAIQKAGNQDT